MPGIVGIISKRPDEKYQRLVETMVGSMEHERFYTSGVFSVPELGIYAGWVAHKNSLAAGQTFFNEKRDIALIFSGEYFLDLQTSAALRQKGHELKENKAEWLVHLYEEESKTCFEKVNGLFSGLLIDKSQKKAFLFNDRYGVERIYWHENADGIFFASEAKALLRILPELREFDLDGVAQFLTLGCTVETRTLFRQINILDGGSLWLFEGGNCHKGRYFSPATWEAQPPLPNERFLSELEETFERILPRYFESDLEIGISLTAGLDSRMIMACLPEAKERLLCYTFSSQDRDTLDARLAAQVARVCGLEHRILRITQDFFSQFESHVDRTVYITDGYLGALGAHEIYLNNQARSLAPVRLTGVFGGEILRELSMFKPVSFSRNCVNADLGRSLDALAHPGTRNSQHPVTFAAFNEIPYKRFGPPAASRSQLTFRTPYLDNEIVALAYRVPEGLRSSPRPALSVIENNSAILSKIPTDMGELRKMYGVAAALRRMFSKFSFKLDYFYNEGLPHWLSPFDPLFRRVNSRVRILGLHKFLHYRSWFQRELAPYITSVLTDSRTKQSEFWNPAFLEHIARENCKGRRNYVREIDVILTLEAVERLLLRELPRGAALIATSATLPPSIQSGVANGTGRPSNTG